MASDPHQSDLERLYTRWAILRWYAGNEEWYKAFEYARGFDTETILFSNHLGMHLFCAEVLGQCGYAGYSG